LAKKVPLKLRVRADKGARKAFIEYALHHPPTEACIFWNRQKPQTYVHFRSAGVYYTVHRVVCERHNGPPPMPNLDAAHSCGNRGCANPRHLRWATRVENALDTFAHGTRPMGETSYIAKLTEEQAKRIKYADSRPSAIVASELGVHPVTVRDIRNGRTWKHV
jgi:hypothetical protein